MTRAPLRQRVLRRFRGLGQSLLAWPAALTALAVALFAATSYLDSRLVEGASPQGPFWGLLVFAGGPQAAGDVLSSIAATWATIAGVVYSVTLVTLQLSATKYSAQVVPAFERDRLNQLVLGVFTGTFVYALLVLKTVRLDSAGSHVPIVGVNVAIGLAVVSLFLFIAFVANLTAYIRPTRFVDDLARRAIKSLGDMRKPAGLDGFAPVHEAPPRSGREARIAGAAEEGYVGEVRWAALRRGLGRAGPQEMPEAVALRVRGGARVEQGDPLLALHGGRPAEELAGRLGGAVGVQAVPDASHDPIWAADTLADIGVTSLSGGSTDVGVAKACVRALARVAVADARAPAPAGAFRVDVGEGRSVTLHRSPARAFPACLVGLQRVLDKAAREGYWDVGEAWAVTADRMLSAAAAGGDDDPALWPAALAWLPRAVAVALAPDDPGARARVARHLALAAARLDAEGRVAEAHAVRDAVLGGAGEAEEVVRTALAEVELKPLP